MMKKRIIILLSLSSLVIFARLYLGNKEKNNDVAIYIDDNLENSIPKKGEATYLKSVCDQDVEATWDDDIWGLKVNNLSSKVNCKLYFSSDTEKPQWQISNVSKTSGLTTDDYTIEITGTDNIGLTSNLTADDITLNTNDTACWALKKNLTKESSDDKQIKYQLSLSMPGCAGNLSLSINQNTLTDTSGNNSDKVSLDTGITISKNNTKKMLIWQDYYNRAENYLKTYYENVTVNENATTQEIISAKYDIVIFYRAFWQVNKDVNTLYNAGINLITQANDYTDGLLINDSTKDYILGGANATIEKKVNNNLTSYFADTYFESDSNIYYWHFNSNAKVLYQTTYNGVTYDKIGYLKENNHYWFNIGTPDRFNYAPMIEFIFGNLKE